MADKGKADSALNDKITNLEKQVNHSKSELKEAKKLADKVKPEARSNSAVKTDVIQLIEMKTSSL